MGGFLGGSSFNRTVCGGTWAETDMNQLLDVREGVAGRLGCCPAGSFMGNPFFDPFRLNTSCDVCPIGRFTSMENDDTSCRQKCPAGKSSPPNSTSLLSCQDCDAGTFSFEGASCQHCPAGKWSEPGAVSTVECSGCPSGRILSSLPPTVVCSVCPAGTFQPIPHLDANVQCQDCVGKYISDEGNVDTEHDSMDDCKYCDAGKKLVSIAQECQICEAGKFQNSNQAVDASCVACNGRYITDAGTDETKHDSMDDCK